jgi:hypothetical protein
VVERYGRYYGNVGSLKNDIVASTPPPETPSSPKFTPFYAVSIRTSTGDALMEKPYVESTALS